MDPAIDHIVLLHYVAPPEAIDELLDAHRTWLRSGYADGVFRDSGPCDPRTGGVIVAGGVSREALERRLAEDPFARAGVATYETVSYRGRGATS